MLLEPCSVKPSKDGLELTRCNTGTLQVNTGLLCNQACAHCHLEAGPARTEIMPPEVMAAVAGYARRGGFRTVDITGGAPELIPGMAEFVRELSGFIPSIIFRTNLTALNTPAGQGFPALLKDAGATIVASFPSADEQELEKQRGSGVFSSCIEALRALNAIGYGQSAGLNLDLVYNPPGSQLPPAQADVEDKLRADLRAGWGIEFNRLYTLANAPVGRFRKSLESCGKLGEYLSMLSSSFNPANVAGVMCRTLVTVSWDGFLYDCDFNLAAGIPLGGQPVHVSEMEGPPAPGSTIAVSDHCFACTAGSGFT